MSNLWLPNPPSLADALCVEVESGAGDDCFNNMLIANQATVDWTAGKVDTGTYLEVIEETLDVDPVIFVQDTLDLYLPGIHF